MEQISNTVYHYYLEHIDELSQETKFHLASRLYQWDQDPTADRMLTDLKDWFTTNGDVDTSLQTVLKEAQTDPYRKITNSLARRQPYFEKYPQLRACNLVLFRMTFLYTIYGIDCRDRFDTYFDRADIDAMHDSLLADRSALAILSTYATNFLYLYDRFLKDDETSLPIEEFLRLGETAYDLDEKADIQLLIYLYTHCIIGESLFYYRALPQQNLPTYRTMVERLEGIIEQHFKSINLDNKFEFLVAARLVGYTSKLGNRIADEAARSWSPDGKFLIDTVNDFPQTNKIDLDGSEHRNVLCIMAQREFKSLS